MFAVPKPTGFACFTAVLSAHAGAFFRGDPRMVDRPTRGDRKSPQMSPNDQLERRPTALEFNKEITGEYGDETLVKLEMEPAVARDGVPEAKTVAPRGVLGGAPVRPGWSCAPLAAGLQPIRATLFPPRRDQN